MNDVLKAIDERRSCRKFKTENIKEEDLNKIINAGLKAPSGANSQSCHFTVLQNKDIIKQINNQALKGYESSDVPFLRSLAKKENYDLFYNSPTVVVVSANNSAITPKEDMAVASQNMMLAAHSLGIASCWVSFSSAFTTKENKDKFSRMLELPENHDPHHAIVFGYREGNDPETIKIKDGRVNYVK